MLYSLVFPLMKAQSSLFHGRYTASAIEGASCFEMCQGGNVVKTDRFDPFNLIEVANSITSLVHKKLEIRFGL